MTGDLDISTESRKVLYAAASCRGCGCAGFLVRKINQMTSSALLGAAEGAVERNDVNPTHRHGNVQGTDGGVLAAISGAKDRRLSKRFRLVG